MKWVKTACVALLSAGLIVPLLWLVWLRAGPTAVGPTEDPAITWNRAHEGLTENAAPYYEQAILVLEETEQPAQWAKRGLARGEAVPRDLVEWVDEKEACLAPLRRAAGYDDLWFDVSRVGSGMLVIPHLSDYRTLAKFLMLRARVAHGRRDLESLAECLVLSDRLARHVMGLPTVIARMTGTGCASLAQVPLSLRPFAWPNGDADKLLEYSRALAPLNEPYPDMTPNFVTERDDACWNYGLFGGSTAASTLIPKGRFFGEVHRMFDPLIEIAGQTVVQQLDPLNPPAIRLAQLNSAPPSIINLPRSAAYLAGSALGGMTTIKLNARVIAMQRGNRTARAVFEHALRRGGYPESLELLADVDSAIDPYTGKAFIYRRIEDGFTLYSAGIDRDDDGGAHNRRFGEQRGNPGQPEPPADGDYVFWPIPDPPRKIE